MTDWATAMFWRGKPISELTREELIEALEYMTKAYDDVLARSRKEREMRKFFRAFGGA
jgi:hypothetical protein